MLRAAFTLSALLMLCRCLCALMLCMHGRLLVSSLRRCRLGRCSFSACLLPCAAAALRLRRLFCCSLCLRSLGCRCFCTFSFCCLLACTAPANRLFCLLCRFCRHICDCGCILCILLPARRAAALRLRRFLVLAWDRLSRHLGYRGSALVHVVRQSVPAFSLIGADMYESPAMPGCMSCVCMSG